MDEDLVYALTQALDIASPAMHCGEDDVAAQDFIGELKLHGYKIVKETEQ